MDADVSQIVDLGVDIGRLAADIPRRASLVVRKSSADLEAQGKARSPVDTGDLRNSIGTDFGTDNDLTYGDTGPNVEYGAYVEFGHRRANGTRQAPQPYMMPAADVVAPNFVKAVEAVMKL